MKLSDMNIVEDWRTEENRKLPELPVLEEIDIMPDVERVRELSRDLYGKTIEEMRRDS